MTLADRLKPLAHKVRGIPGRVGVRPHSVSLLTSSWSGTHSGDGTRTDTTLALTEGGQNPKVRWATDEERVVGGLSDGTVDIGPLTPDHDGLSRLDDIRGDALATGDARYLTITGPKHPNGARYRIIEVRADRGLRYMLRAAPEEQFSS